MGKILSGVLQVQDNGWNTIGRSPLCSALALCLVSCDTYGNMEINRLETLAKINVNVRLGEISMLKEEQKKLEQCLGQARSRLDSIRLIWKGSMERLQN